MILPQDLKKLLINILPLAFYLEQISLLIITKGLAQLENPTKYVMFAYYAYLGMVYAAQILKYFITKYIKGYRRGVWMHSITTFLLAIQIILVISALIYENSVPYRTWYAWELTAFLILWSLTIIARSLFVLLIILQVLSKKPGMIPIKQTYWLALTTKNQLFETKGGLIHDPRSDQKLSQSLIDTSETSN